MNIYLYLHVPSIYNVRDHFKPYHLQAGQNLIQSWAKTSVSEGLWGGAKENTGCFTYVTNVPKVGPKNSLGARAVLG